MRTEDPDEERDGHDEPAYRSTLRIELEDGTVLVDPPLDAMPPGAASPTARSGGSECVASRWSDDEGWGVVEGADVPGGCWVHFSVVDVPEYRTLQPGQAVLVDWEERDQNGFTYTATRVSLPPAAPR
jgi:CspA family cold shock protein